jgi:hypothetical protein
MSFSETWILHASTISSVTQRNIGSAIGGLAHNPHVLQIPDINLLHRSLGKDFASLDLRMMVPSCLSEKALARFYAR